MASRNELTIIRAARAGHAPAQLALGRRYLFGGNGLPRSPTTALYWLDRAASQQEADAWMLIGRHVPFEIARQSARPANLSMWYERAYDAGLAQAGLELLARRGAPGQFLGGFGHGAFASLADHRNLSDIEQYRYRQWRDSVERLVHDVTLDAGKHVAESLDIE